MAYYYDHQVEIDAEIQAELSALRSARSVAKPSPFELRMQVMGIL
jgi:hypothetical protein